MQRKSLFTVIAMVTMLWLGCMAWLSGYKQGYSEGSETAWSDARSALMKPLPTLNLDSSELVTRHP